MPQEVAIGAIAVLTLVGIVLLYVNAGLRKQLEELQDEYHTLVDRDPKTGRFVKSMRTLKRD
jgi:hypothetical protein